MAAKKMNKAELYRIGGFTVYISESFFEQSTEIQNHLIPFRVDKEELSKYSEADIKILDCRSFEGSLFDSGEGKVFYKEEECSNPTKFYLMPDHSLGCEMLDPANDHKMIFHISSDWSEISLVSGDYEDRGIFLFTKLCALFAVSLLLKNACIFHGVVMDYQGKGILVMAHSGVGKSTHTNRWEAMGYATILNGDRCLCRKIDGQWYAYGMPWAGSSNKHLQARVPVRWIIDLKRGAENHVEEMSAFEREVFLLQRMYAPVTRGEQQENAFAFAHELAESAVVKRLFCRPDEEAVLVLKEQIDAEDRHIGQIQ